MRIEQLGLSTGDSIVTFDFYRQRAEFTQRALAFEVLRNRATMPNVGLEYVLLEYALKKMKERKSDHSTDAERAKELRDGLSLMAKFAERAAYFFVLAAQQDLQRYSRDIENGQLSSLSAWLDSGAAKAATDAGLDMQAVRNILSIAGTGHRLFTERRVAEALSTLLAIDVGVVASKDNGQTPLASATVLSTYTRALEFARGFFTDARAATPPSASETSFQVRATKLRDAAYALSQLLLGAQLDVAKPAMTWLQHPWVKRATRGRLIEQVVNAVQAYEALPLNAAVPAHGEAASDRYFDFRVLTPFPNGIVKPVADLPIGVDSATVNPLFADRSYNIPITQELVSAFIANAWVMIDAVQQYYDGIKLLEQQGANLSWTFVSVDLPLESLSVGVTGVSDVSDGYPLAVTRMGVDLWTPDSRSLRGLPGLSRWQLYTYEKVRDAVAASSDVQRLPIFVKGTSSRTGFEGLGLIIPRFKTFNVEAAQAAMNLDGLLHLWRMSSESLKDFVSVMPADPENPGLRGLADMLRFVGVLYLEFKAGGDDNVRVVPPLDRLYYRMPLTNALAAAKRSPGSVALDLGSLGTTADLKLQLMTALPQSSRAEYVQEHLKVVAEAALQDDRPVLVWEYAKDPKQMSFDTPFSGWAVAMSDGIVDLVSLPVLTGAQVEDTPYAESVGASQKRLLPQWARPVHIFAEDEQPQYARYYDAVVSLASGDIPVTALRTSEAPPRRMR